MDGRDARRAATALRSGLRGIREAPLVFASSVFTMAAGLSLLAGYLLIVHNMQGVLDRFGHGFRVVAFLDAAADLAPADRADLEAELTALPGVGGVRYVSRDEALSRLEVDLGRDAAILEGLRANPLPASVEIEVAAGSRTPASVRALAETIGALDRVSDVRYGEDWVEGYSRALSTLEWFGLLLGGFLMLVLGAIVAGTVRLALHSRADEIEIQRLVGAGRVFVRIPFYLEGALQGGMGAAIALSLLYGLFRLGLPVLEEPLRFVLGRAEPSFFGVVEVGLVLLIGVALGLGGAVISLVRLEQAT